jgi:hypothetical protein
MNIPQLPVSKIIENDGYPTPEELLYRQNLNQALQSGASEEGLVAPTQMPATLVTIQNAKNTQGQYSCQLGTILYIEHPTDYTQDKVVIAVRNDNTYPNTPPIFKTVTLT